MEVVYERSKLLMKKRMWLISRLVIIFAIITLLSCSLAPKNYGANLEEEKKKQEQLQKELKDTQALLKKLEGLKGDTEAYIKTLDKRLNDLADNIYNMQQSVTAQKVVIEETKVSIANAQKEIESQYEAMKLRIQYQHYRFRL